MIFALHINNIEELMHRSTSFNRIRVCEGKRLKAEIRKSFSHIR